MARYSLFIDDERDPPRDGRNWIVARHWEEVMMTLRRNGMPGYISFDHDLGQDYHTGHDIAKLLIDLDMDGDDDFALPPEFDFYVHSQNPVGRDNINGLLTKYLEFRNSVT
jgi:hypothetical protein